MSVFDEQHDALERYETQYGASRGKLALSLDLLTDALVLTGQHGVYCASARNPAKPAMDLQLILKSITDSKDLIGAAMQELRSKSA